MQPTITTGWLRQKRDETQDRLTRYKAARLDESQLPQVMELQKIICRNLQRPDLLQSFTKDFMKQHLGRRGVVLGVFVEERLIAFRNLYYPEPNDSDWNLGIDLNLAGDQLNKVVNFQMVCVHPDFRGNRLALMLNRMALQILRNRGRHPHVCATVSPYNIWNIPVLLATGFHIARLKIKYGGKVRYIVHQDLYSKRRFDDDSAVDVCLDDLDTQKRLLDRGFYGVQLKQREPAGRKDLTAGFNLVFKRPIENGKKYRTSRIFSLSHSAWHESKRRRPPKCSPALEHTHLIYNKRIFSKSAGKDPYVTR
jgi:hypothetical protein